MKNTGARSYFRAFYRGNRFRFVLAMLLMLLTMPAGLIFSWILGTVIDIIAARDLAALQEIGIFVAILIPLLVLLDAFAHYAKTRFVHIALEQYKNYAFSRLSEKSISAFARENTGRYISVLTNDINSVEESYLLKTFYLVNDGLLFIATLVMMFWYSPSMTVFAIFLSAVSLVISVRMGGELVRREMAVSDEYGGSITVDGRELRSVDPDSLYDVMSLIGQNVFLFDDTIRRNITMFRDFSDSAVNSAVKRSGLAALVAEKGESYRCGENGVNLSGGERQRISIARALLRGTPVLMLDEATAALDNQTAFEVTDAILHLDGLTRIVVTHRLEETLLEQYDEIIVLRGGSVCEQGTFQALMERKDYFYSLYTVTNG